jgi:hypothetical protein
VTHHAVENLSDLNVSLVIRRDYFSARTILTLIVGNLTDVLGKLVDGKAGARIDGLTLN